MGGIPCGSGGLINTKSGLMADVPSWDPWDLYVPTLNMPLWGLVPPSRKFGTIPKLALTVISRIPSLKKIITSSNYFKINLHNLQWQQEIYQKEHVFAFLCGQMWQILILAQNNTYKTNSCHATITGQVILKVFLIVVNPSQL